MKEWKNKNSGNSSNKKGKNSSRQSNTTMDLKKARIRFIEIANKTGIHGEETKQEPNPKEREELWDITRSFLARIYTLDDKSNLSKEEVKEYNELCYWSVAALHWNDYVGQSPTQYPGRFRRDTIALALCLYIRISKDYEVYENIKTTFIKPHLYGSVILWICSEMKIAERDIYFDKFDIEFIKKADEQRRKFFFDRGGLFLNKEDNEKDYDKIVEILYELLDTFSEEDGRSFSKFILTYIKTLKELLPEDLENNTKYIESTLLSSSTPESTEDIFKEVTLNMLQDNYSGKGKYTYDNGDVYVGDFKDSSPHGKGTYTFKNGYKSSGEWKQGKMHGFGIKEHKDGGIYKGEYKEDIHDGFGELTWPDGDSYIGEFSNGEMNGKGIFKTGDKEYSGTYKDGKLISKDPVVDFSLKVRNIALQKEHGLYEEKETGDLNKAIEKMQDGSLFEEKEIHPKAEKTVKESSSSVYEIISKGIQNSKALPNQPFIKEELENQGFKNLPKRTPWFYINSVAVNISGEFANGCLLVDMDGFYSNCVPNSPDDELKFILPWDNIYNLQINDDNDDGIPDGITELVVYLDENKNPDEAKCLSIINKMEDSSKLNSPFSVIKSIYDNMWKRMIDEFRGQPIFWGSHIDWFTQEVFSSNEELIEFYSNYQSKDKEKKTKDQKEKEALEKFGMTKKDLAEKVLKNISVSQENPEAYAFVKAVSAKDANMQDILNKYEHIFDDHINFADEDGYTAMHYACWDNKRIILEMLIDFGANPNVLSPTNESPINMAVVSGHLDIVQFFVDYDVEMELNIDWENRNKTENPFHSSEGSTLIRDAVLNQHWDIFDVLIDGIGPNLDVLTESCSVGFEGETNFFVAIEKFYKSKNIDYNKERLELIKSTVEGERPNSAQVIIEEKTDEGLDLKTENKILSKDASIWEIIQHEFINLDKESVLKKDFSEMILKKYPHIKKGTLGAQISIQVINKRGRTNYAQCSKERVCGDNKYDFLFENDDKTLCKYDKDKHGIWEIYKREDGKLDVRIHSNE